MDKQVIYVTLINTLIGLIASIYLKDNAVVAWIIAALVIGTIIFIERGWLKKNMFKNRRSYALAAYSTLAAVFLAGLFLVTGPMRKTGAIVASTSGFLTGIKAGDYNNSYARLSQASRQSYPLADFIGDHSGEHIKIEDFTIEQVTLNKFDSKKALAIVSSPFQLYGHEKLNLELIREEGEWRVVFSRKILETGKPSQPPREIKKVSRERGKSNSFFNSLKEMLHF